MYKTYFNHIELSLLLAGFFLVMISIVLRLQKKEILSVVTLIAAAIPIFLCALYLDPFLNPWDERFHALVAKNMMDNPFKPMLYTNPILDMEYNAWDRNVIWLHKQPLFLWQIAISYKLFGANELALRLPSALMSVAFVFLVYRIGSLMVNKDTGYFAAILATSSFYLIELVAGRQGMEHNDVAFTFYITASIWAWLEYLYTKKQYWIVLIGVFSGAAILCKWLVGLLVYLGWGGYTILKSKFDLRSYLPILMALLVTIVVALPWQLYTLKVFPAEAQFELNYNSKHFTEIVEGHGGKWNFYLKNFTFLYGRYAWIFIFPALLLFYRQVNDKKLAITTLFMMVFVYLFFSVSKTKLVGYPFILASLVFVCFGTLINSAYSIINKIISKTTISKVLILLLSGSIFVFNIKIETLQSKHTDWKKNNNNWVQTHNKRVFRQLPNHVPQNSLIFNIPGRHYVECMFYSEFTAYQKIPTEDQFKKLLNTNYSFVFLNTKAHELPPYIKSSKRVIVLDEITYKFE